MFDHEGILPASHHWQRAATTGLRLTWLAALFAVFALGGLAPREASAQRPKAQNFVYVESDDPAGNAIFAFARNNADGSLEPLAGSPFPTGGLGITFTTALGPFDSDQEIIVNSTHTLLFAVNGGSDTIAVFRINADGSLTPVEGSPFPSGGSNPVSVGLSNDDVLVVVNQDQDPDHPGLFLPNYTSFQVSPQGQLTPVRNSTISVDLGSSPSQALISPGGGLMFGAEFLGGLLRTLQIRANGRLIEADAQPLPPAEFAGTGAAPCRSGWRSTRRGSCFTSISSRSAGSESIATTRRESSISCAPCRTRARHHAGRSSTRPARGSTPAIPVTRASRSTTSASTRPSRSKSSTSSSGPPGTASSSPSTRRRSSSTSSPREGR